MTIEDGAITDRSMEAAPMLRRSAVALGEFDAKGYFIRALVATDHPVRRQDARGMFLEVLDPAGAVLTDDLDVPFLDAHNQRSARATIGRAYDFAREPDGIAASLRFSLAADVTPLVERVKDGSLRAFSIGYRVLEWRESKSATGERVRTATRWTVQEVSLVPIPADPNARKRNAAMDEELDTLDVMPEADQNAIRAIGENLDLPPSAAEEQITAGASVADARLALRTRALEGMRARSASTHIRIQNAGPSPDETRAARVEALACRMNGATPSDAARPFMGLRLLDHASDSLAAAGISTRGMAADDVFVRAGTHTTSDFPILVSNAMGKVAQEAYKAAESPLRLLCKQRNLSNFKTSTAVRLGELGRLEPLSESGEFRHTTRAENGETMSLETYGRAINVSRKLLIDDDLNLLGDMNAAFGEAAAQTEADILFETVTSNPKLSDAKTVFHATRGNIGIVSTASGGNPSISVAALNEARRAMRGRKGLDGRTLISATPKYLLVGPERETEAEAMLAELSASTIAEVNPFAGKLQLLVEPRIEDGRWYVFADPARLPCLQFGYLASAPGVQIQRAEAWDVLGAKFRAWLDFGAAWLDWRGAQLNAGA
ncbi:prohead protease/major capsid protein fusion protein [Aureimonas pseudogalii]|uniref:HK97 family phage prohead protease n=1 Tax=Aureimonas pseudogalii TaxID=1744844 RepID=A0A7W6H5D3_9HYPH|nr:prohead protease/major capsid protein fusion protein [Aureimonas pseudogalii]MBB3998872.1 HK97 family phage prohead protease [Aureimonas pseudogalii]